MKEETDNGRTGDCREGEAAGTGSGEDSRRPFLSARVDIYEFDDSIKLWIDIPGVKESDVEVTLKEGVLTITGTVSTEAYEKLSPLYTEYNVGNYFRQFELNEDIDDKHIGALMKNGVLELTLPKGERAQPRPIEVRAG